MTRIEHATEATDAPQKPGAVGSQVDLGLDPLPDVPPLPYAVFDGFGRGAHDRVRAYAIVHAAAAQAAERERAARVCDDEARIRTEAGNTHPEDSDSRGRCFAAARAAINCAKGVRGGEVVGPNAK